MVDSDTTNNIGSLSSRNTGLTSVPTSGWLYADGAKFVDGDDTLMFSYN